MRRSGVARAAEGVRSRSGSHAAPSRAPVDCTATSMELPAQDKLTGTECARRGAALPPGQSRPAAPASSS